MHASNHARMLAVAPGGWDRCTCRHCRLPESDRRLRRSARRIERQTVADEIAEALAGMTDPDLHPEDAERSLGLDWLSQDIMAGNTIWDAWDHADRAQAAAAEREHRIAMFDHQATWDPTLNERCFDRDLPGWRGTGRYGVSL